MVEAGPETVIGNNFAPPATYRTYVFQLKCKMDSASARYLYKTIIEMESRYATRYCAKVLPFRHRFSLKRRDVFPVIPSEIGSLLSWALCV